MKKSVILISFVLSICTAYGQSSKVSSADARLDLQSKLTLLKSSVPKLSCLPQPASKTSQPGKTHTMSLIKLNGADAPSRLESEGVHVLRVRGDIAICSMPLTSVEKVATLDCVKKVELPRPVYQMMDKARHITGVDDIHSGTSLPQAYTGKGVVCGVVDNGFDPNHVNFLDESGKTRFGYMSKIYESTSSQTGYVYENYYPREEYAEHESPTYPIEDFKTDDKTDYHGTHTLGIMAGGYKGKVRNATYDGSTVSVVDNVDNPYYGCATDAELVASCGDLYDDFISFGCEDIINYADYSNGVDAEGNPVKKKPCVISLSLGRVLGGHDKNSLINQYLTLLGKDAIVCMAAGNNADYPICLKKTLHDTDTTLQSFVKPIYEGSYENAGYTYHNLRYGSLYAYSNDSQDFEIQLVIFNKTRGRIAKRFPVSVSTSGTWNVYVSSTDYYSEGTVDATLAKYFDGYIALATQYDEATGRYYAMSDMFLSDNQTNNADGNYLLGLVINGKSGQKIDVYGDDQYTYFSGEGVSGWQDGQKDGSINDMAIADNVIVVGSYNVRDTWGNLDGTVGSFGSFPAGEVTYFSSYGTLDDGTTLPHICAPGAAIISSTNSYMVQNSSLGITNADLQASATVGGSKYYWEQGIGTSMSAPFVAGAIALWLEADPTLKYADVIDIIKTTAKVDEDVTKGNPVQWGAGKFDAYAGLQEVLRRKSAGVVQVESGELTVGPSACYNLSGQRVDGSYHGIVIKNGHKIIVR